MPIPADAYNLSTGTKWKMSIPFKEIDEDANVDNLTLNVTDMTLPELEIVPAHMSIRGRRFSLPTGVKEEDKLITVGYMLSSNWHQYRFLYKWYEKVTNIYNGTGESLDNSLVDIYVKVISEYKNTMFDIIFKGCWLSKLGKINLNYQTGVNEINHSFSFYYQLIEFKQFDSVE